MSAPVDSTCKPLWSSLLSAPDITHVFEATMVIFIDNVKKNRLQRVDHCYKCIIWHVYWIQILFSVTFIPYLLPLKQTKQKCNNALINFRFLHSRNNAVRYIVKFSQSRVWCLYWHDLYSWIWDRSNIYTGCSVTVNFRYRCVWLCQSTLRNVLPDYGGFLLERSVYPQIYVMRFVQVTVSVVRVFLEPFIVIQVNVDFLSMSNTFPPI